MNNILKRIKAKQTEKQINRKQSHTKEYIHLYKLTNLRLVMIAFSIISISLGLTSSITYSSEYLNMKFNYDTSGIIIPSIFVIIGITGLIISMFLFEKVQSNKYLYIPLSIINVIIGIVGSKIIWAITTGKEHIMNNKYIKMDTNMPGIINWLKEEFQKVYSYEIGAKITIPTEISQLELLKKQKEEAINELASIQEQKIMSTVTEHHNLVDNPTLIKVLVVTGIMFVLYFAIQYYFYVNDQQAVNEAVGKHSEKRLDVTGSLKQANRHIKYNDEPIGTLTENYQNDIEKVDEVIEIAQQTNVQLQATIQAQRASLISTIANWISAHPYMAVTVGVGGLIWLLKRGSVSTNTTTTNTTTIAAPQLPTLPDNGGFPALWVHDSIRIHSSLLKLTKKIFREVHHDLYRYSKTALPDNPEWLLSGKPLLESLLEYFYKQLEKQNGVEELKKKVEEILKKHKYKEINWEEFKEKAQLLKVG